MAFQLLDEAEKTLRHLWVIRIADEDRIAPTDRQKAFRDADAALTVIATDHDVVIATLFSSAPHHHRHAKPVVEAHRILMRALTEQDQTIGGLHRRVGCALSRSEQHAVTG